MKLYYVDPPTYEATPEGEDNREWFASRRAAERAFNEWVETIRTRWEDLRSHDVELHVVELADLPRGKLALAILNGRGFAASDEKLREWTKPREEEK